MSKYIIEIAKEYEEYFKGILICGIVDGKFAVDVIAREDLEELNSDYINEHFGDLQDTAYQKGFEDGKAVHEKGCEGCKYQANRELTCPCSECANNYKNQWTAKQTDDKIEVGDEVEWTGDKCIVTYINYDIDTSEITDYDLLCDDGSVADHVKKCSFTKTGRHFDIAKILEAMRND